MCPAGSYCDPYELFNSTGVISPVDCPAGFYCPAGTEFDYQNPCEPGTFSNVTQLTAQGQCAFSRPVVALLEFNMTAKCVLQS